VAAYLARRLTVAVTAVIAVSFASFLAFGLSFDPTGPLRLSPDQRPRQVVLHAYHLSDPILVRYWLWFKGIFSHGFGTTVSLDVTGSPPRLASPGEAIGPVIWHGAAVTAQLVAFGLVLTILGSAVVGIVLAQRMRPAVDIPTRLLTYVAASVPTFLIAYLLKQALVPNASYLTTGVVGQEGWFKLGPPSGGVVAWFQHLTLPALALGLTGVYARYVRTAMLDSLGEQYTTVARAKGLPERRVVVRHVLRNSLVPVVSLMSLEMGAVVGASLAADAVFSLGGLASAFLSGLAQADPFEMTALVVVTAIVVSVFLILTDLLVALLDPRIRVT
jgi:ABC-type dipeptide/oligopeptide/nickel transport system permease component